MTRWLLVTVSDPWDFGTERGVGSFECPLEDRSDDLWLVRLVHPIQVGGVWCHFVRIKSRLKDRLLDEAFSGKIVGANFLFGDSLASVKQPYSSRLEKWAAIGSIQQATSEDE